MALERLTTVFSVLYDLSMAPHITKENLRVALRLRNDAALAKFLGVSGGAVSQWGKSKHVPDQRLWQAKSMRPDVPWIDFEYVTND